MTVVKLITQSGGYPAYLLPQGGAWGGCRFALAPDTRRYDWLVVFNDLPVEERLACPRENTILITTEPASLKIYPDNYLRQFGIVADMQTPGVNRHPRIKRCSAFWGWGGGFFKPDGARVRYEEMLNMPPPPKNKWLSVVCSNAIGSDFHLRRFNFCARFVKENPQADFFGKGIRPIADKADALSPYRFHLAVENFRERDHWTEKFAESILAYCVTAYCGCPNIADYFPPECLVPVDIGDYDSACAQLSGLDESEYRRRFDAVKEARHILLTKHHPAAKIAGWIDEPGARVADNGGVIKPVKKCQRRSGVAAFLGYTLKKWRHKERRRHTRFMEIKQQGEQK